MNREVFERYKAKRHERIWSLPASLAWAELRFAIEHEVTTRLDGDLPINFARTRSEFSFGGQWWIITIDQDGMVGPADEGVSYSDVYTRPQHRNGRDFEIDRGPAGAGYRMATLDFGLHELVREHAHEYGRAEAYRRAAVEVKEKVNRLKKLRKGDIFPCVVYVSCEALGVEESCGGFDSDDHDGMRKFVAGEIYSALKSKTH